uniref:Uncharacterized protein LOC111107598 n=1 Tax=Crassostrea virginica TaxID=6565 RepID=A0A8B8B603_CRAVI|nr:uncharacterized protein LOC111107598 [Crassostrea virginica]
MDPDYIPQDVVRCDLCKTAIAQSYCDSCHVKLCKPCIGEHISDDYKKHIVVPILQRKTTLFFPNCETHQNEECKYQCQDCSFFVCSHCTASLTHSGHKFLNLEELFNQSKKSVQFDREELDNQIMPAYEEIAIDLENKIANLDVEYKNLKTELSKQREEIHREVDNAIHIMEKEIDEIKVKHHSLLQKHLGEIKQLQSLMQQTLLALNEMEESTEVSSIIQYSSKNGEFRKLPPKVHVSMPKFIPKQTEREELCRLIGKLTSLSTTLEERFFTAKKPNTSVRELLDEPELLNTIKTGHTYLHSVTCLNEEQIWTSGMTADIKCFNIQGVLQKTIKTKSGGTPWDIAVDTTGALLYCDKKTRTLYKVQHEQTEKIITLQGWNPNNLCVTSSDDLLVTMYRDHFIKHISENRNMDICVADYGAVVVVNQAGKFRFKYTGHPSLTFKPSGITTDSQGRILTANMDKHCIHITDAHGQFLRYINNCDLWLLCGLCVDNNDNSRNNKFEY